MPLHKIQISLQRFARGPLKKTALGEVPLYRISPTSVNKYEKLGRGSCGSLSDVLLTQSIFTKGRLFIKNSYTEFHKNPTNALVAHTTSQTGRSTSVSSQMRSQIFDKRRKMSPHIRWSYPWITNLPTKKKFNFACVRHFVPLSCFRHFVYLS